MRKIPLAGQSHNPFPSAHGLGLGFQETGLEYILRPEREGLPSSLTDRIAWKGAGPEELFVLFFLNPYDQNNASLKGGRGDFSRPLEREAKASPTQSFISLISILVSQWLSNPPNPPLAKGGKGDYLIKSFFYD